MDSLSDLQLQLLIRAPGSGIPAFSAGVGADLITQRRYYAAIHEDQAHRADRDWVKKIWLIELLKIRQDFEGVVILGVPSDTGGGIRRGAALGPRFLRERLAEHPKFQELWKQGLVVDAGDVYCHPQLLLDEMLSSEQIEKCRSGMYGDSSSARGLPVSPLSVQKTVLETLYARAPRCKVLVLGGDHSVAWPTTQVLTERYPDLAIIQLDAHTDLLDSRLGIDVCFGSWSSHAARMLKTPAHLIQVGIRQSGNDRGHWEKTKGVVQIWGDQCEKLSPESLAKLICEKIRATGSRNVFLSNDIDGTDATYASATGTPAAGGLMPKQVIHLIRELGKQFQLVGADLCEVAPALGPDDSSRVQTGKVSASYLVSSIRSMLGDVP
ncbi:MAG: arginase family protein [Bdellovibrionales bacterium]|nr:arginase family protein [Bdellovibrionales bacterium]